MILGALCLSLSEYTVGRLVLPRGHELPAFFAALATLFQLSDGTNPGRADGRQVLAHYEMLQVAVAVGVDPLRVNFRHCLQLIRVFCMVEAWTCAPGNIPKRLSSHLEMMESLLILPPRRSEREYERHVKIKMSGYKRNPGRPESKRSQSRGKSAN